MKKFKVIKVTTGKLKNKTLKNGKEEKNVSVI